MAQLDEVLTGQVVEEQPVAEAPEVEQEAPETQPEAPEETPTEEPKGVKEAAPPVAEEPRDVAGIKAAMLEERRKRQELEAYIRQQKAQQPPEEKKDIWDDPEGFVAKEVQRTQQLFVDKLVNMSVAAARRAHADYDEKLGTWQELINEKPDLYFEAVNSPDPGEFAYQVAARHVALKEVGNPIEYRAKLEAEIRAKVEAEYAAKKKAELDQIVNQKLGKPFSEVSAAGASTKHYTGPPALGDILK